MPRQLQSKIHSDFSSETYKWEIYQAQAQELFDNSTSKADFNAHLIREYNRKINNLNQPSQLYLQPYDAGFGFTGDALDGLKLSLDLNFDANTTYSQSTVGSTTFTLASRYGPNASFSRLSPATFRGSNGLIQYAPENLLSYSEQFDNAYWTKVGATVTPNNAIGPDGLQTADRVVFGAANNEVRRLVSVSGTTTASIYIKGTAGETIAWSNGGASPAVDVIHTLSGGWDRVVFTTTATNPYVSVNTYNSVTARTIYIWGAQLERSSTARPYISTTSTAVYGPRLEYDVNGNALGLLIEESSSNLLAYSEQFDQLIWGKNNLNTTGTPPWVNVAIAPNGTLTADKAIWSNGSSDSRLYQNTSFVAGQIYTMSAFVKPAGFNKVVLSAQAASFSAIFDLESISSTGASAGYISSTISNVGNGWFRVSVTGIAQAGGYFFIGNIGTGDVGNGTSGIYIWGAQLEQKAYPTSYIPTAASGGVIRAADTCTLNIDFPLTWFNESEGTIMVEGDRLHSPALNAGSYDSLFIFSAGGGASLGHFGDGTSELFAASDGSNIVTALSVSLPNQPLLFVGSYSTSFGEIYVSTNNTVTQSQAGFSGFSTPDTITFGYSLGINEYLNGHIKSFKYYKKSLDSTIMEALPL